MQSSCWNRSLTQFKVKWPTLRVTKQNSLHVPVLLAFKKKESSAIWCMLLSQKNPNPVNMPGIKKVVMSQILQTSSQNSICNVHPYLLMSWFRTQLENSYKKSFYVCFSYILYCHCTGWQSCCTNDLRNWPSFWSPLLSKTLEHACEHHWH